MKQTLPMRQSGETQKTNEDQNEFEEWETGERERNIIYKMERDRKEGKEMREAERGGDIDRELEKESE